MNKLFLNPLKGKKGFQSFFSYLHKVGLEGMNYGQAGNILVAGEIKALGYIHSKIQKESPIILDVGANKGKYILAIKQIWKEAIIHAFEPSQAMFNILKSNFSTDDKVHLYAKGLGEKEESLPLYGNKDKPGLSSLYPRELSRFNIEIEKLETIELDSLDHWMRHQKVAEIDLLKIDVEGHEMSVLRGAKQTLTQAKIRFIQFEFGGCAIDSKIFFKSFWDLLHQDFRIYRILKNGLEEIVEYKEELEIFSMANFLAERKNNAH